MNSNLLHKVFGKSIVVVLLVAVAVFTLGKVPSVHADVDEIRLGQTVTGWIPTGDEIRWYKFEASPGTLVKVVMTRKERDLVPYLALRYHDGQDYQFIKVDHNNDRSNTAQVSAVLPVTHNGYWIEAASLGSTSGTFSLQLSTDSMRNQGTGSDSTRKIDGYNVTFTIDKITCNNPQDGDGLDELDLTYSMVEQGPSGSAVDDARYQTDMWMKSGFEFDNFVPLNARVQKQSGVRLYIQMREDDEWPNKDETLAEGTNYITMQQLNDLASSGKPAQIYWPITDTGTGQYHYEITYSVHVQYIYGLDLS